MREKVLLVDDDPEVLEALTDIFESAGYEVTAARNGEAALLIMESLKPNIIVSDFEMPKMDGLQFLQHIREQDNKVPFVIVSGLEDAGPNVLSDLAHYGTDMIFHKPPDIDDLLRTVDKALKR